MLKLPKQAITRWLSSADPGLPFVQFRSESGTTYFRGEQNNKTYPLSFFQNLA